MAQFRRPAGTQGAGQFLSGADTEHLRLVLTGQADLSDIYAALQELEALGGSAREAARQIFQSINQTPNNLNSTVRQMNNIVRLQDQWTKTLESSRISQRAIVDNFIRYNSRQQTSNHEASRLLQLLNQQLDSHGRIQQLQSQGLSLSRANVVQSNAIVDQIRRRVVSLERINGLNNSEVRNARRLLAVAREQAQLAQARAESEERASRARGRGTPGIGAGLLGQRGGAGRGALTAGAGGTLRNLAAGTLLSYSFQNFPSPELGTSGQLLGAFSQAATFGGIFVPGLGGIISSVIGGIGQGIIGFLNSAVEQQAQRQEQFEGLVSAGEASAEAAQAVEEAERQENARQQSYLNRRADIYRKHFQDQEELEENHLKKLNELNELYQREVQGRVLGDTRSLAEGRFGDLRVQEATQALEGGAPSATTRDQQFQEALQIIDPQQAERFIEILNQLTQEHESAMMQIDQQVADEVQRYNEQVGKITENFRQQFAKLEEESARRILGFTRQRVEAFDEFVDEWQDVEDRYRQTVEAIDRERDQFLQRTQDSINQFVQRFGATDALRAFAGAEGFEAEEGVDDNDAQRRRTRTFEEANRRINESHALTLERINFRETQRLERYEREQQKIRDEFAETNEEREQGNRDALNRIALQERHFNERYALQAEQRVERFSESMDRIDLRHRRALNDIEFREIEAQHRAQRRIEDAEDILERARRPVVELITGDSRQRTDIGFVQTQAANIALQRARAAQESLDRIRVNEQRRLEDLQRNLDRRRALADEDRRLGEDSLRANFNRQEELAELQLRQFQERIAQQRAQNRDSEESRKEERDTRLADLAFAEKQAAELTQFQRDELQKRTGNQSDAAQRRLDAQTEEDRIAADRELANIETGFERFEKNEENKRMQADLTRDNAIKDAQEEYEEKLRLIRLDQDEYERYVKNRRAELELLKIGAIGEATAEHNIRLAQLGELETQTTTTYTTNTETVKDEVIKQANAVLSLRDFERAQIQELIEEERFRYEQVSTQRYLDFQDALRDLNDREKARRVAARATIAALKEEEETKIAIYEQANRARLEASGIDPNTGTVTVEQFRATVEPAIQALLARLSVDEGLGATPEGQTTLQAIAAFGALSRADFNRLAEELSRAYGGRSVNINNIIDLLRTDAEFRDTFLNLIAAQGITYGRPLETPFISGASAFLGGLGNVGSLGIAPAVLGSGRVELGLGDSGQRVGRGSGINDIAFSSPVGGRVTSEFGVRTLLGSTHFHAGQDFAASPDDKVIAPEDGVIEAIGYDSNRVLGIYIIMRGDSGLEHLFGHIGTIPENIQVGTRVSARDQIGTPYAVDKSTPETTKQVRANISQLGGLVVGEQSTTGTHIHYEIIIPDPPGGDDTILDSWLQQFSRDDIYLSQGNVRPNYYRIDPRRILGFQFGGPVENDMLAYVHRGEFVMSREHMSQFMQLLIEAVNQPRITFDNAEFSNQFGDRPELEQTVDGLNYMFERQVRGF